MLPLRNTTYSLRCYLISLEPFSSSFVHVPFTGARTDRTEGRIEQAAAVSPSAERGASGRALPRWPTSPTASSPMMRLSPHASSPCAPSSPGVRAPCLPWLALGVLSTCCSPWPALGASLSCCTPCPAWGTVTGRRCSHAAKVSRGRPWRAGQAGDAGRGGARRGGMGRRVGVGSSPCSEKMSAS